MEFERFTVNQRVQHIILLVTFLLLVATGLPLKYRETWGKSVLEWMGFMTARSIHKWAAVGMTAVGVWHVFFYTLVDRGKKYMWPRKKDFTDFIDVVKFRLGRAPEPPKFDRFYFMQKFDYWGAFWGFVIMIGTGMILWFREELAFLPMALRESARTAHAEEAILAVVFVLIFHMIHTHINREVFPMDKVFLTGKIPEDRLMEEHPLEYERIKKEVV
jgi:cytochrome b subunit of formate dehydrogenase